MQKASFGCGFRNRSRDGFGVTGCFFWCDFHPYILPSALIIVSFAAMQASGLILIGVWSGGFFRAGAVLIRTQAVIDRIGTSQTSKRTQ
jgi:hypothetical protein